MYTMATRSSADHVPTGACWLTLLIGLKFNYPYPCPFVVPATVDASRKTLAANMRMTMTQTSPSVFAASACVTLNVAINSYELGLNTAQTLTSLHFCAVQTKFLPSELFMRWPLFISLITMVNTDRINQHSLPTLILGINNNDFKPIIVIIMTNINVLSN